jgi:RecA/RadA recombinase
MSAQDKKNKAIAEAVKAIHKQFGSGAIMRLDGSEVQPVEVIPTGSVALDVALGCGGLPRGRIIEIYGPESSGKTTLTLHAIAEAQRQGGVCAFVDAEHALDTDYARRLGVQLEDLLVSQPDCGEQALEIVDTLVRTGAIDLIVVDSVAALTPKAEIEGDMGDAHMGLQARLMSQALRKLTAVISKTRTSVIFIKMKRPPGRSTSRSCPTDPQSTGFYPGRSVDVLRTHPHPPAADEGRPVANEHVPIGRLWNEAFPRPPPARPRRQTRPRRPPRRAPPPTLVAQRQYARLGAVTFASCRSAAAAVRAAGRWPRPCPTARSRSRTLSLRTDGFT